MTKRRKEGIERGGNGGREGGEEGKGGGRARDKMNRSKKHTHQPISLPSTVYKIMNSSMCECIYYVFIIMIQ